MQKSDLDPSVPSAERHRPTHATQKSSLLFRALMALHRRPKIKVEIRLPGITIGTDDIGGVFGSRTKRGPFLILSRASGMALDTGGRNDDGSPAGVHPADAGRRQLWYLAPSGHSGELLIVSADNGLALDATRPEDSGMLLLWERHGEPWQRWMMTPCPDGAAYYVASVAHGRVMVISDDAEPNWQPWLEERRGIKSHQWMFVLPHGSGLA